MKTNPAKKIAVHPDNREQQENLKNARKTLKVLQQTADKENLVGRSNTDAKLGSEKTSTSQKPKKQDSCVQTDDKSCEHKATQTGGTITAEDLMSDEPSVDYWKVLAGKREDLLNESFKENERLKEKNERLEEKVEKLEKENSICKSMLDESKQLVEVLQEMLEESPPEAEREDA